MNILVAKSKEECSTWRGNAVVVDVLYTSTTACALLKQKDRLVGLCANEKTAQELTVLHPGLMLFSQQPLTLPHQDNSPYLAGKLPANQAVLLIEAEPARAIEALQQAKTILLGGFCNFRSITQILIQQNEDVLVVPATLLGDKQSEEDVLCAEAFKDFLQGTGDPQSAIGSFGATVRFSELRTQNSKTASNDLNLALRIDGLPTPVQVIKSAGKACVVCCVFGYSDSALKAATSSAGAGVATPRGTPSQKTQRVSKLKEFFSALIESAKEEKEDLERSIRKIAAKTQHKTGKRVEDPLDMLRKQTERQPASDQPAEETNQLKRETPSASSLEPQPMQQPPVEEKIESVPPPSTHSNSVQKDRAGKRGISLGEDTAEGGIKISDVGENEVKKDAFGRRSISLDSSQGQEQVCKVKNSSVTPVQQSPRQRVISLDTEPLPLQGKSATRPESKKKAIVLFSGGLDSTTCLYWAIAQGYTCETLTVSYGQRHVREIESARKITERLGVKHHFIELNLPWLGESCSLFNRDKSLPDIAVEKIPQAGIPSTYVPGRNLMFLSIAGSLLDSVGAQAIIAGPNAIDFSGYPDCTPAFFKSAAEALNRGTKQGVQEGIEVLAPLMRLTKAEIVKLAAELKVPFELTWSCYAGGGKPCGKCDSCKLRAKGFAEAGVHDTALD